jgi:hypothetical protein
VLFILPSFILCLLFTNLQPRFMQLVYDHNQMPNTELPLFGFKGVSYGSLLLIYPILFFTNLNRVLFVSASCLIFPQIYLNALRGRRPKPISKYYLKYLFSRFLFIVLPYRPSSTCVASRTTSSDCNPITT